MPRAGALELPETPEVRDEAPAEEDVDPPALEPLRELADPVLLPDDVGVRERACAGGTGAGVLTPEG